MQVANALNNTIRILFNPKVEKFRLFDFLVVKSLDDRYLAQIIEIYEDKFDSSQNVAKLKLFYKIAPNNEVMPYDNFTPSKECEISKVKSDEVENFINNDKETFIFATDAKNSLGLNIQYDFFNNNAIILADKIENANAISLNLAKKLSSKKHAVILDFTGVVEFEEAKTIKACKNFKMPLNYSTMNSVFDRCLSDASLEFQAIGMEILNAVKQFAKKQELGFIPFNAFVNVILEQYKATPYSELKLLLARMKKSQMNDIFAKNKKDYETLSKTIQKNPITIIDLSGLDNTWQRAYVEYIVSELEEEVYLIARINDESFDIETISNIYNKKQNIKFIPNVSYNYFKLPSIIQYCKNYILMPSLNQRNDFLDANFALSNLISDGCIIFGENTDNFLYLARDYELEIQEKRKNYRKIALHLISNDENVMLQPEEENTISDSQKLMQELSNFEEQSIREHEMQELQEAPQEAPQETPHDEFQEIMQEDETNEIPKEVETIKNIQEIKLSNEPVEPETIDNIQDEDSVVFENVLENEEASAQESYKNEIVQQIFDNDEDEAQEDIVEQHNEENAEIIDVKQEQETEQPQVPEETKEEIPLIEEETKQAEDKKEEVETKEENEEAKDDNDIDISDEELDFFELAESSAELEKQENIVIDNVEYKVKSDNYENNIKEENEGSKENKENDLDLSEVASKTVENNFEEIINTKVDISKPTFEIDENTTIQVDLNSEKENLPIFKEEEQASNQQYEIGNVVVHKKYGKGTIIKTIQYDQRQLLQIDFVDSGKKLLDPKIAEIQLEQ